MSSSDRDCAIYAAGFFDGEGSINISLQRDKRNGSSIHALMVSVTQIKRAPLDYIKHAFGGCIRPSMRPNGKPCWRWQGSGRDAEYFLIAIYPFTFVKTEEIEVAIEFRETVDRRKGKRRPLTSEIVDIRTALKKKLEGLR